MQTIKEGHMARHVALAQQDMGTLERWAGWQAGAAIKKPKTPPSLFREE